MFNKREACYDEFHNLLHACTSSFSTSTLVYPHDHLKSGPLISPFSTQHTYTTANGSNSNNVILYTTNANNTGSTANRQYTNISVSYNNSTYSSSSSNNNTQQPFWTQSNFLSQIKVHFSLVSYDSVYSLTIPNLYYVYMYVYMCVCVYRFYRCPRQISCGLRSYSRIC